MPRLRPPSKEDCLLLPPYAELTAQRIYIPATDAEFAVARTALLSQQTLGFDTESKPLFHVGQVDTGPHLVQLATPDAAWLLQLHHPQAMALSREILAHPGICKVGFGLDNDKSSLPQRLGVELAHIVDLDSTFKAHGYGASTGVRAAAALVLGVNFQKSKKQSTSNWAATTLSPAQIRYAANDAHAPATIYAALPAWQAQQPAPHSQRKRTMVPAQSATEPRFSGTAPSPSARGDAKGGAKEAAERMQPIDRTHSCCRDAGCTGHDHHHQPPRARQPVPRAPQAVSNPPSSGGFNPKVPALFQAPRKPT